MLYDMHLWEDTKESLTLTAYDNELILPNWVNKVLQIVHVDGELYRTLGPFDRQNIYQIDPELLDKTGDVIGFSMLPSVATHTNPAGSKLTVQSSEAADTASIRIQGINNGNEINETVNLSGTSLITTQYYYDRIHSLSKPVTTGYVEVKKNDSEGTGIQVLLEDEDERRHQRVQLHRDFPITSGKKLLLLTKKTCTPMVHDNDTPQLEDSCSALIAFSAADMLMRMRQLGKAQFHLQEANAQVTSMMDKDKQQKANVVRFVPES